MTTDVALTSIIAYYDITDLEERQQRVLRCIRRNPGVSRNDIARIEKMDPKNVSSRLWELKDLGRIVVVGKKRDHRTKRWLDQYVAVEK